MISSKGPSCYFPFIAGGLNYTTCTMAGQNREYWCSTTDSYDRDGEWMWCNGPVTSGAIACYFPFLYKGVQISACVKNVAGAYKWCSISGNYDKDGKAIYCLEVDFKTTSLVSEATGLIADLMSTASVLSLQDLLTTSATGTTTTSYSITSSKTDVTSHVIYNEVKPTVSSSFTSENGATSSKSTQDTDATSTTTSMTSTTIISNTITTASNISTSSNSTILNATSAPASATGDTSNAAMLGNTTNYTEKYSSMTSATTSATHSSLTSVEYTAGTSARFSQNSTNNTQLLEEWLKLSSWNSSTGAGLDIIPDLQRYTSSIGSFGFNKDEVPLIANILGNITQKAAESNQSFSVATLADILYIANQLFNESSWGPATTTNHDLGPQMLQSFESVLAGLETMNQPINISFENIDFQSLTVPCVHLVNETALELGSDINVSLSDDASQANFTHSCLANLLSMSYRSLSKYFPNDYEDHRDPGVIYKVSSRIVTNTMFIDNRNHHSANISMSFLCEAQDCQSRAICVFWNFTIGKWSSEGCTTVNNGGVTSCLCGHLTSFSVLLSDILPEGLLNVSILDYITNVGLMISIASLVACISLQMYLLKGNVNLVAYYRHMVILNVSSFLLLSNISFVGASYIKPPQFLRLCVALTFCTHFSLLAFFCWTLVQSIFLFCRLVFVFHHITKKEFMTVSTVLGYVTPMLIAVGTFLYYTPTDDYRRDTVCWLQSKSGASMAFTIPTIVTISLNFLVLIVVIKKLLRKSISEGSGEDEEVVKKLVKAVVFCTPQFGLTWAIGIPLLTNGDSLFLQYLFVLLNPLQGFFIFVFGCLLDKKVMDLVKRRLSKSPAFSSTATTVSTY